DFIFLSAVGNQKKSLTSRALQSVAVVAEHYARGAPVKTAQFLIDPLLSADPKVAETILTAMARNWPQGKTAEFDPQAEKEFSQLALRLPASARAPLYKLAMRWGYKGVDKQVQEITEKLLSVVTATNHSDQERLSIARQVVEFQPENAEVAAKLLGTVTPAMSPELAAGMIDALATSQAPGLGTMLVKKMPSLSPSARAAAVRVLLERAESTRSLLDGVDQGQVQLAELSLKQKQGLADHPNTQIAKRARALLERG